MAKYLSNNAGTLTEVSGIAISAGAADAGKFGQLDGTGRYDNSFMPVGIGADTAVIQASEALSAGNVVNIHDVAGAFRVRKADGATSGKAVDGFVLAAVASAANATVYFEGTNTALTGLTPGMQYLSATTPGAVTATVPTGAGQTVQRIGPAVSATALNFEPQQPITLV